jgi:hypothetical protein
MINHNALKTNPNTHPTQAPTTPMIIATGIITTLIRGDKIFKTIANTVNTIPSAMEASDVATPKAIKNTQFPSRRKMVME